MVRISKFAGVFVPEESPIFSFTIKTTKHVFSATSKTLLTHTMSLNNHDNPCSAKGISKIIDKLQPAEAATISGFVGQKFYASYKNRILAQDVDRSYSAL